MGRATLYNAPANTHPLEYKELKVLHALLADVVMLAALGKPIMADVFRARIPPAVPINTKSA